MTKIQFYGAARTVTGSKHLITTATGTRILLDCGMFQGMIYNREELNRHFGFAPHEIDYVVLSHAHIDHCGLLPRLVKQGFRGVIFATPATISLSELMLLDSAYIQNEDLKHVNKRRAKRGEDMLEPLYDEEDVSRTLSLMEPVEYDELLEVDEEFSLRFTDAGHLLGSASVHLQLKESNGETRRITFSGDIGRYNDQILRQPQTFDQCDVLICESTYGNRQHPKPQQAEQQLLDIIKRTCVEQKGRLIIPAFSVDRTQDIVFILDKFANMGKLPNIRIYVDSPLSVKATGVIRSHEECFNDTFLEYIRKDPDPFGFKNLVYVSDVTRSKAINNTKEPCVIISASGMAEAGRVKHHIANNIANPNNTILLVGYCTPESLGGRLKAGNQVVRIFGENHEVKARVEVMDYFSAHADYTEILRYLKHLDASKVKQTFLVHGEPDAQEALKERLEKKGFSNIHIPSLGEEANV
jgi:metallo-beta-lactamase family protein